MMQVEQLPEFQQQVLQSNLRKKVRQLTAHLVTVLHIDPIGHQLAAFICPGESMDNTELVYGWVLRECCCISCIRNLDFQTLQYDFVRWLLDHDVPVGDVQ
ncbi:hypothetical protein [Rheinheimera aquimaris]|uniref:hypothetical protein n=1 Tax=Rheinheimera aquimaris TaxID=412437 RepID=UPI00106688DC|nr:hypothetical protein [Rheinheimera aquimaris]